MDDEQTTRQPHFVPEAIKAIRAERDAKGAGATAEAFAAREKARIGGPGGLILRASLEPRVIPVA